MPDVVVLIHGGSALDTGSASILRRALATFGLTIEEVCVTRPDSAELLAAMLQRRSEIKFFLSLNLWAMNIHDGATLLHRGTGIPLVFLLQDHPAYFLPYVSSSFEGAIMFAPGEDCVDFIKHYYPANISAFSNPGFLPNDGGSAPDPVEFRKRKNEILCLMNLHVLGLTLDQMWQLVKQLPQERKRLTSRLIEAALTESVKPLHSILQDLANPAECKAYALDLRLALNFIKGWRRTKLVRDLIDLPVVITSEYVPADLEARYPRKFLEPVSTEQVQATFHEYRFVLNSTPMLPGLLHERIIESLVANAVSITNDNAIVRKHFKDQEEMIFVGYDGVDLPEKISRYLDDPDAAFLLTVNADKARRRQTFASDAYGKLIDAVSALSENQPKG